LIFVQAILSSLLFLQKQKVYAKFRKHNVLVRYAHKMIPKKKQFFKKLKKLSVNFSIFS
jgi:hypothetical protein